MAISAGRALRTGIACLVVAPPVVASAQTTMWEKLRERPPGTRHVVAASEESGLRFATEDFATSGPARWRGATLVPRIYYADPQTGRRAVFYGIAGLNDIEFVYIVDREGRILERRLYSYWSWPSHN